jgi:flagellar motor switch protein FliM
MFTKSEIDALLARARSGHAPFESPAAGPTVEPFDFLAVGQLSPDQVSKLLELHAGFAPQLARSLSHLLGSECTVNAASVDQMAYGDLVKQFAEGISFSILETESPEGRIVLLSDLTSVLPIIDLLLGGTGAVTEAARPLTEIEQQIFEPVLGLVGSELQKLWAPLLRSQIRLEHHGPAASLIAPNEKVLFLQFEIQMGEQTATWALILPAMVSSALTRKVELEIARSGNGKSQENERRMRERLMNSRFRLELSLPPSTVSVGKLANLKVGQVVVLKQRASDPLHFNLAEIKLFQASAVSCGARRGAQIRKTLLNGKSDTKEPR